jgi:hypothetical protein
MPRIDNLLSAKLFENVSSVFVPHSRVLIVAEFFEKKEKS